MPRVVGDTMESIEIDVNTQYEISKWGIKEPIKSLDNEEVKTFDICITPLLYADIKGNRVGYGKGFYDRFFIENNVERKIGINYFGTNELISDCCKSDIKLDFLITPHHVIEF